MTRYIKQRDSFSCAPVTILNARKWLGHPVSYARNYAETRARAATIIGCGTLAGGFLRASRDLPITRIRRPNWAKIKQVLRAGHAVIVCSYWPKPRGNHIFLVTRCTDRSVFCVNVYGGHVWRSLRIFRGYYLYRGAGGPAAWIVRKPSCLSKHKLPKKKKK